MTLFPVFNQLKTIHFIYLLILLDKTKKHYVNSFNGDIEHVFENACKSFKTFGRNRESDRQIDID